MASTLNFVERNFVLSFAYDFVSNLQGTFDVGLGRGGESSGELAFQFERRNLTRWDYGSKEGNTA